MPTIPVPHTIMAELIFVQHSVRMENVLHFTVPGTPTLANLVDLRNALVGWDRFVPLNATHLCQNRSTQNTLVAVKTTSLHGINDIFDEYVLPAGSVGTVGNVMPTYATIAIKLGTGLAGRSYRGRIYHCGMPYLVGSDGFIAAGSATLLVNCYTAMKTQTATAGFTLVVASKYSGVEIVNGYRRGIPRAEGITTPVTTIGCERGLDTNRHRKVPHIV